MIAAIEEAKQTGEEEARATLFTAEQVQAAVDAAKVEVSKEAFAMGFNEAWRTARLVHIDNCPYDVSDPKHPSQRAKEVVGQAAPAVLQGVTGGLYKWTMEELTDPLDAFLEKPVARSKYNPSQYYEDALDALHDFAGLLAKDE
jgi:hypothetical protein